MVGPLHSERTYACCLNDCLPLPFGYIIASMSFCRHEMLPVMSILAYAYLPALTAVCCLYNCLHELLPVACLITWMTCCLFSVNIPAWTAAHCLLEPLPIAWKSACINCCLLPVHLPAWTAACFLYDCLYELLLVAFITACMNCWLLPAWTAWTYVCCLNIFLHASVCMNWVKVQANRLHEVKSDFLIGPRIIFKTCL